MRFNEPLVMVKNVGKVLKTVEGGGISLERMFKTLVEKSNDIIIISSTDFVIKYIAGPVEKLFDIHPEEAIGKSLVEFIEGSKEVTLRRFVEESKEHENIFSEVELNCNGGELRYFDVTVSNLIDNKEISGLVLNLHDITSRKNAEDKLRKANNELDHFIYKTSHDLRAPLLSAIGLANLADQDPERERYDYLKMIKQSLLKLDNYIEDINAFYRNEKLAVRQERIDIDQLFEEEFTNLITDEVSSKIKIDYNITRISDFFSDAIRLKAIITNVLSNAIKYSDGLKNDSYININVQIMPDNCVLKIEDNGIGIRAEYLENIFDIFYRADENAKGSGLGLYIVKDTVDKLNGHIEVQSEYGKGTAFTITIPNYIEQRKNMGYAV